MWGPLNCLWSVLNSNGSPASSIISLSLPDSSKCDRNPWTDIPNWRQISGEVWAEEEGEPHPNTKFPFEREIQDRRSRNQGTCRNELFLPSSLRRSVAALPRGLGREYFHLYATSLEQRTWGKFEDDKKVSFLYICHIIDDKFRHNIVKVAVNRPEN